MNWYFTFVVFLGTSDIIFQDLKENKAIFDRGILHRGVCLPNELNFEISKGRAETLINANILHYNLTSTTEYLVCTQNELRNSSFDYIVM